VVALIVGCGDSGTTTSEKSINITESDKNGDRQIDIEETDKDGDKEVEIETGDVSEEEIGVPIYPGAKLEKNASGTVTDSSGKYSAAVMYTDDDYDKVVAWYESELKGKPMYNKISQGGANESGTLFMYQDGDEYKTVTIGTDSTKKGKTVIAVASGSGMPGTNR